MYEIIIWVGDVPMLTQMPFCPFFAHMAVIVEAWLHTPLQLKRSIVPDVLRLTMHFPSAGGARYQRSFRPLQSQNKAYQKS